jgi:hypothetical protein
LPARLNKKPQLAEGETWSNGLGRERFTDAEGIGIICGKISGGLECMDFDNHFGDATENLIEYLKIPEVKDIYNRYKLPIEKTQGGGFHLIFRCSKNEGSRKLAQRWNNEKNMAEAIIETKGEKAYFVAYPTPGYVIARNDIFNVETITEFERAILIDNAISFNEFLQPIKTEFEQGDRPGDIYNSKPEAIVEMIGILSNSGWKHLGGYKWRRPGKDEGISATLGKVAPNVFYVFTSNAHPFEPLKAYTPFQVLGLIKYNGDFKEAARSIVPEKEQVHAKQDLQASEIEKLLSGARIDTGKPIEKPPSILSIKEQSATSSVFKRIFTLGNFSCLIGKAKSRKTFLISMFTAALLDRNGSDKFISEMPIGKSEIIYFDTEQGEYDSFNVVRRIETMSGTKNNLIAFNLRPFSPVERCQIIDYALKLYGDKCGFCVIDGIADLANGINDEEEATRVTTLLLRWTKTYNLHITTVIHQNKNDNFATGHLGSSIMKKAEIIISVSKSKDEYNVSEINCDMSRGIDFEPFDMIISQNGFPEVRGAMRKQEYKPEYEDERFVSEKPPF